MAPQAESIGAGGSTREANATPRVTAQETVPGRLVFTEDGNTDGWVATDLAVDPAKYR